METHEQEHAGAIDHTSFASISVESTDSACTKCDGTGVDESNFYPGVPAIVGHGDRSCDRCNATGFEPKESKSKKKKDKKDKDEKKEDRKPEQLKKGLEEVEEFTDDGKGGQAPPAKKKAERVLMASGVWEKVAETDDSEDYEWATRLQEAKSAASCYWCGSEDRKVLGSGCAEGKPHPWHKSSTKEAHQGTTVEELTDDVGTGIHAVPHFITDHKGEIASGVEPATCALCGQAISLHAQWNPSHQKGASRPVRGSFDKEALLPISGHTPSYDLAYHDLQAPPVGATCQVCGEAGTFSLGAVTAFANPADPVEGKLFMHKPHYEEFKQAQIEKQQSAQPSVSQSVQTGDGKGITINIYSAKEAGVLDEAIYGDWGVPIDEPFEKEECPECLKGDHEDCAGGTCACAADDHLLGRDVL